MKPVIILALLILPFHTYADTPWQLKKDQEGIKVYTATKAGTGIKAIKVECIIQATPSQLTALLLDAKAHEQWVYSTATSRLVKTVSAGRLVYYSKMDMPWPLTDRDVVVDFSISQAPATRVLTVKGIAVDNQVPEVKDNVRVHNSEVTWTVTPLTANSLKIEYTAQADPGGSVPVWAVNMFSTKGPFETFRKLRTTVLLPRYKDASFDFIKD